MVIYKNLKIDFAQCGLHQQVSVVQGDCMSRGIIFSLYENGTPMELPDGVTPALRYGKSDGTGGVYDTLPDGGVAWSASGNAVSMILAPQVMTVPGLVQCQLMLANNDAILGSFAFHLIVEPDPAYAVVESKGYFNWSKITGKVIMAPTAEVGQIIRVKAVDTEGVATEWEAVELPKVPAALPNPYPLILTGAVNAEYDGTEAVSVEIPDPGRDFSLYGLGTADNPLLIPSDYALADMKNSGWYSIELGYGTVDFGDGFTANKFLLRVESGASEQYTSVTKQTAIFASYPGAEEYFRYCKNGYDWTAWQSAKAGGGGLSRVLLWENADPYSEFVAQTIQINGLSDYDAIEILYTVGVYQPGYGLSFKSSGAMPNLEGAWEIPYSLGYVLDSVVELDVATDRGYRAFHLSGNTITFRDAYEIHYYGDEEVDNTIIIPARIYGIVNGAQGNVDGGGPGGESQSIVLIEDTLTEAVKTYTRTLTKEEKELLANAKKIYAYINTNSSAYQLDGVNGGVYSNYQWVVKICNNLTWGTGSNTEQFAKVIYEKDFGFYKICRATGVLGIRQKTELDSSNTLIETMLKYGMDFKMTTTTEAGFPIGTVFSLEVVV